jgi:hypothetical protein
LGGAGMPIVTPRKKMKGFYPTKCREKRWMETAGARLTMTPDSPRGPPCSLTT